VVTGSLGRPIAIIHMGTCMKLAIDTADWPIDFDDMQVTLETRFGVEVVLGTPTY
jgi:hypothetical protein